MKCKIGNTTEEIEVGQYRLMEKGSLKAFFSVVFHPSGQKILDCRHFMQGDREWFSFPQKEAKYTDGRKTEYIPLVSYLNKEYLEQLKSAVMTALRYAKPTVGHGKPNQDYSETQANTRAPNKIPAPSPVDWDSCPF